jgi:hypothetical protein
MVRIVAATTPSDWSVSVTLTLSTSHRSGSTKTAIRLARELFE